MANRVDPDETARYELSHLDLGCLSRHLFWSIVRFKPQCSLCAYQNETTTRSS